MTPPAEDTERQRHGGGLPLETPVMIFVFNRPDITRRTLDAVRAARPTRLFLIADGPRDDRPDDRSLVEATRAVLDEVDWPCEVTRRFSATNLGVEASVELGLDWAFSQVSEAIVLEDDCVADPTFFTFADQLLSRYRNDTRVWQISGNNFGVPEKLFPDSSYGFTAWGSVWGWATWADRWHTHRAIFTRDHRPGDELHGAAPIRTRPPTPEIAALVTQSGQRHFADAATSQDIVSHGWDKHWWLTMMTLGGLAITPGRNLVENVGWGADAAHGVTAERQDHPAQPIEFPLRHPADVAVDVELERELELVLSRVGGRTARVARALIRSQRARQVARRIAHSRIAVRFARSWSRVTSRSPRD
jgi:hypothetical protein